MRHSLSIIFLSLFTMLSALAEPADVLQTLTVREPLARDWTHEMVLLPLDASAAAAPEKTLLNPAREPIAWQLTERDGQPHIAFMTDLPAQASLAFTLTAAPSAPETPFTIAREAGQLRIFNQEVGIALPATLEAAGGGPIAGVLLPDGTWAAASALAMEQEPTGYELQVIADGPVFAELLATYTFADDATWSLRYRLLAGDEIVRIDESWSGELDGEWHLALTPGLQPDTVLWRNSTQSIKPQNALLTRRTDIGAHRAVALYPWLPWWMERSASFAAFFQAGEGVGYIPENNTLMRQKAPQPGMEQRQSADEMLSGPQAPDDPVLYLAVGQGAAWAEPGQNGINHGLPVHADDDGNLQVTLRFAGPGRVWLIGVTGLRSVIVPNTELPAPQAALIRHLETPLQEVLDMTLSWDQSFAAEEFPRLYFDRDDIQRVRDFYADRPEPTIGDRNMRLLWDALMKEQPDAIANVVNRAMLTTWKFTDHVEHGNLLEGEGQRRPSAPAYNHHITMGLVRQLIWVDAALATGALEEEQLAILKARLAYLAYEIANPDFYDLSRNYRANPNMTTSRHAVVGLLGSLLKDHPKSAEWIALGEQEILRQLDDWVGPNGGWLECPHYQTILLDALSFLQAAHRIGASDLALDPRLLSTIRYLARISTPPDPRFTNRRHFPAAGNTYRLESSMIFSIFAHVHKEANPEVARELQWTWQQHGQPMIVAIGGYNVFNAFSEFAVARFEVEEAPAWGSEVFPYVGTVMRHGFPGNRESQLYILHGPFDQHYDHDRGALTFWGLGQPLMLDWGYDGRMPRDMHTMMGSGNRGKVVASDMQPAADFLRVDFGDWQRQILLAKSTGSDQTYTLIRDTTQANRPIPWYAWFYTDEPVQREGDSDVVRMTGQADVDLDIWFANDWASEFPRMTWKEVEQDKPPAKPQVALQEEAMLDDDAAEDFLAGTEPPPPPHLKMRVEAVTAVEAYVNRGGWSYKSMGQRGLSLSVPPDRPVSWLLAPRLKTQESASFTELADGRGVRIESAEGTDLLLLGDEPFEWAEGKARFNGQAGAIQLRGDQVTLTLSTPGTIAWGPHELTADKAATQTFTVQ